MTCLCVPEDVPDVRGREVRVGGRPDVGLLVQGLLGAGCQSGGGGCDEEHGEAETGGGKMKEKEKQGKEVFGGRWGVCASGPERLTRQASNAVARFAGTEIGARIGLHTEVFAV